MARTPTERNLITLLELYPETVHNSTTQRREIDEDLCGWIIDIILSGMLNNQIATVEAAIRQHHLQYGSNRVLADVRRLLIEYRRNRDRRLRRLTQ